MKVRYIGDKSRVTLCDWHNKARSPQLACNNGCPGYIDRKCRCSIAGNNIVIVGGYDDLFIVGNEYFLFPIVPPIGVRIDKYGREIKI